MQAAPHNAKRASIPSLVVGIIKDAISLVSNEVTAARLEVYDELEKVKSAVLLISLGAGALMVGSIFLGHMLVHLLQKGKLDQAGAMHALETVARNVRAEDRLIGEMLDVSRLIAGKVLLDLHPVELMDRIV